MFSYQFRADNKPPVNTKQMVILIDEVCTLPVDQSLVFPQLHLLRVGAGECSAVPVRD